MMSGPRQDGALYLGIDLGTSGCRAIVMDTRGHPTAGYSVPLPAPRRDGSVCEQAADLWWEAVLSVLREVLGKIEPTRVRAIAVDGTSSTTLLADAQGRPLAPALMYNDTRSRAQAAIIAACAPADSAARGASSSLAKALFLVGHDQGPVPSGIRRARHVLHQADWIAGQLSGRFGVSDENNALKLGYDPVQRRWPDWLREVGIASDLLPKVVPPGRIIAPLRRDLALDLGLSPQTSIVAGTTDSTAAFLATGACVPGDAVTSLGSTLVLKVLSAAPVFAPEFGVYSHRLGDLWLAGGASNSGGVVLRHYFTQAQLDDMTSRLDPDRPTGLNYYPLVAAGERFPVYDPDLRPRLSPRPQDDGVFFQGLLEGMAEIEWQGYQRLKALGAPSLRTLYSVGGGANNPVWTRIRGRRLGVKMAEPVHKEAAYGAALLARQACASSCESPVHACDEPD